MNWVNNWYWNPIPLKTRRILMFLGISLLVYFIFIFGFAMLYYFTESICFWRATKRVMEPINFLKAVYFSVVSFHTIGYGDIYPISNQGRLILMIQGTISLFYTSVFAGLLVYFIIKRHADVFSTKKVYIRKRNDKWYFSIRLGNRGKTIIDLKGHFEAWIVRNDSRIRIFRYEEEMADLERILYFDLNLDDPMCVPLRNALIDACTGGEQLHMKFNFIGNDIRSGEQVAHAVYYNSDNIGFGTLFQNVYSWDIRGHRTNYRWKNFEVIEPISAEAFLKGHGSHSDTER